MNREMRDMPIERLIDISYRYDGDFSDEDLSEIASMAETAGVPKDKAVIPELVRLARVREAKEDGTVPYEQLKLDHLVYGKIGESWTMPYGELEIWEERDKVLVSVTGEDDVGLFTAANAVALHDFMEGDDGYLERLIGETLYYGKRYEEECAV